MGVNFFRVFKRLLYCVLGNFMKRNVTILGATGSIGLNTLDVIRRHPDRFRVHALTAATSVDSMASLCREFRPRYAVMADQKGAEALFSQLADLPLTQVLVGEDSLCRVASDRE